LLFLMLAGLEVTGDFNRKFYEAYFKCSSCVGMSKFGRQFHLAYARLLWKKHCASFDGTNFDGSCFADLFWEICSMGIDALVEPDDEDIILLVNIYDQIINSLIMLEDGVYMLKECGNPSGSPNTIVDNTLFNYFLFAYAWFRLNPDSLLSDFDDNVIMNLFGDDNLFSFNPDCGFVFPLEEVCRILKDELGFVYRSEFPDYVPCSSLSFLSHMPLPHEGLIVPALDGFRLNSALLWTDSDDIVIRFQRLMNLRIEGWFTPNFRPVVEALIDKYLSLYRQLPGIIESYNTQYKSAREIERLYLANEACSRDEKHPRAYPFDPESSGFVGEFKCFNS